MRKTLVVLRREFSVTVQRTSFRVLTLGIPALALLAVAALLIFQAVRDPSSHDQTANVGYIDRSGLLMAFQDQGEVIFLPFQEEDAGIQSLLVGEISALYVIPEAYLETGQVVSVAPERAGLDFGRGDYGPLERFLLDNILEGQVSEERRQRVLKPIVATMIEVDEQGLPVEDTRDYGHLPFFIAFALLIVVSILGASGYLLQGLNEEKENRIMEVLLSSVTPEKLMLGKLAGLGLAGLAQMGVWAGAGVAVFFALRIGPVDLPGLSLPPAPLILVALLYFVLSHAFIGALMAGLGAVTTSQREAGQITFVFVLPIVAPMWFFSLLLENPNGIAGQILSLIPFTAPLTGLIRLSVNAMSPVDIAASLGVLAIAVGLAVLMATRLFRAYLLMYGQRPKLKQIARTLAFG